MAFVSARKLIGNVVHRTRRSSEDLVIATDHAGEGKFAVRFSLSAKICKAYRLLVGDRVDILFDTETNPPRGLIRRINDGGGWKIYETPGKGGRLVVKMQYHIGLPSVPESTGCQAVDVTDEGILFDIPENADFTKNVRIKS